MTVTKTKLADCGLDQPQFRVQCNGREVFSNAALNRNPKYERYFRPLTPSEESTLHKIQFKWWACAWATILVQAFFGLPLWLYCALMGFYGIHHVVASHDNNHGHTNPLPFMNRLTGYALFYAGSLPLASTYCDMALSHRLHHKTKCQLDILPEDPDSWHSLLSWPLWVLVNTIQPSFCCITEVVERYIKNPARFWPERVVANLFHWAQLASLYRLVGQSVFFCTLISGHIAMVILMAYFNGLIHRPGFLQWLVDGDADPSGMRHGDALMQLQAAVVGTLWPVAWLEIKWHDIHHSHLNTSMGACFAKGMTYAEIDEMCADACDEGLFVDKAGNPVSPLEPVGHKVGTRKKYLDDQGKKGK